MGVGSEKRAERVGRRREKIMEYAEKEAESYKEETDKQRQFEEQKAC